jgi:cysteinyl-tRNA synthetase
MRALWCLVVLILGCARTFPLCRDEACVLAELVDAGSAPAARDGGVAAQVAYLKSQNTEAGDAFGEALDDDLNISAALAALFETVRATNRLMDAGSLAPAAARGLLEELAREFGGAAACEEFLLVDPAE